MIPNDLAIDSDLFLDGDRSAHSSVDLRIQRDLLDPEAFAKTQLRIPACLEAIEKERSSDRIVFQLSVVPDRVSSEFNSVTVEFGEPIRRMVVPVRINHVVQLDPPTWFTLVRRKEKSKIKETSFKTFKIVSTKYRNMKIMKVTGEEGLVGREVAASGFSLWLNDAPVNALHSSVLTISITCEDDGKVIQGDLLLPVRILVE